MDRRASLLLAAALGCTPAAATSTSTQAPPGAPERRVAPRSEPPRKAPRRPPPVVVQALAELERNPNLHLVVIGPRAEPVRKAMLRAARGRIDDDRIRADLGESSGGAADSPHGVEFRFYVPPPEPAPGPPVRGFHSYMPQ